MGHKGPFAYHKASVHCPSFLELQKGICKLIFWPIEILRGCLSRAGKQLPGG